MIEELVVEIEHLIEFAEAEGDVLTVQAHKAVLLRINEIWGREIAKLSVDVF